MALGFCLRRSFHKIVTIKSILIIFRIFAVINIREQIYQMVHRIKHWLHTGTMLLLLVLILLSSCKTKEIAPTPLPQEIYDINVLIIDEDIKGLISLYTTLKEHKEYAFQSILCDFNIEKYSYEELLELYNLTKQDSLLRDGFSAIIEKLEYDIIDSLLDRTIEDIALHYKSHPKQQHFLDRFIEDCIMANIENMDYAEIKYLVHTFRNTTFHARLNNERIKQRKELDAQVKRHIQEYIKSENESLSYLEISLKTYIITYLYEQYPTIINSIIDQDLPKNHQSIIDQTNSVIYSNISQKHIKDYIEDEINKYFHEINDIRKSALSSLTLDPISNCNYLIKDVKLKDDINIQYNPYPLYRISEIQNETDGIGLALSLVSFFGSFFPGGIILDAIDLGYGIHSEKKRSKEQLPYIEEFSENFRINLERTADTYVSNVLQETSKIVTKSQRTFKTLYNELY